MKKFYLLLTVAATLGMAASAQLSRQVTRTSLRAKANAASFVQVGAQKPALTSVNARDGQPGNSINQLSGSITCTDLYNAGASNTFNFTLVFTNTDFEYGDSLAVTFPAGFTPTGTSNQPDFAPITDNDPSQTPEAYNGVSGQTISWGDDDNVYGGIEALGNLGGVTSYAFDVTVTVDPGVTGPQTIDYFISGDGFGASPGDLSGSITLFPAGTVITDIGISSVNAPSEYSSTPILQVQPFDLSARVLNGGTVDATNVGVTVDVFDANLNIVFTGVTNTQATLSPGDTSGVLTTATSFTPADTGIYYIRYVSFMDDPDVNTSNDTSFAFAYVDDSTYARDETFFDAATYQGGFGFNANTGYLGHFFDIVQASGLTSVSFFLDAATLGDVMSVDVFDVASGLPNTVIGSTGNYTISADDTGGAFITLPFTSMINVTPGQYFVGLNQQSQNNITLGASSGIFTPGSGLFQVTGGAWTPVEDVFELSFILRPNNPSSTLVGVNSVDLDKNITVFPNPSKGYVFIMTNNGAEKDALVTVTNTMGQVVYTNTFSALDNAKIDLNNQADGIYTVRVQTANGVMTKNIMVSNK